MKELDFYSEIPVLLDGEKINVPVTWLSDDYVYNAKDTEVRYQQWGSNSAEGISFNVVVNGNDVYDATGWNKLTSFIVTGTSNVYSCTAGKTEGMSSDKVLPASTSGLQSIKVINGKVTDIVAGNGMVPDEGNRYVYIDGFTVKYIFGGSIECQEYAFWANNLYDMLFCFEKGHKPVFLLQIKICSFDVICCSFTEKNWLFPKFIEQYCKNERFVL